MRALSVATAVSMAVTAGLSSQQAGQQPPVFRSSVDVIQVDVSALDRDGRPVRGLTAADFTLLENGKPREIVAFAEVNVPEVPRDRAAWVRDVLLDVRSNELRDGRLFVVILDDVVMLSDLRIT